MCRRCNTYFTIHNVKELIEGLKQYGKTPGQKRDTLKLWFERGYFTNLIYLEYLEYEAARKSL